MTVRNVNRKRHQPEQCSVLSNSTLTKAESVKQKELLTYPQVGGCLLKINGIVKATVVEARGAVEYRNRGAK